MFDRCKEVGGQGITSQWVGQKFGAGLGQPLSGGPHLGRVGGWAESFQELLESGPLYWRDGCV